MQQLVSHTFAILGDIWPPLVYLIVAVWVGVESAGIGLPIEPMMLFAGSLATQGKISVVLTVLITSLGCLAFAGLAYVIGRREGTTAISSSARRSPSGMVTVSLHRMAITYQMSWPSSQACSHLACP